MLGGYPERGRGAARKGFIGGRHLGFLAQDLPHGPAPYILASAPIWPYTARESRGSRPNHDSLFRMRRHPWPADSRSGPERRPDARQEAGFVGRRWRQGIDGSDPRPRQPDRMGADMPPPDLADARAVRRSQRGGAGRRADARAADPRRRVAGPRAERALDWRRGDRVRPRLRLGRADPGRPWHSALLNGARIAAVVRQPLEDRDRVFLRLFRQPLVDVGGGDGLLYDVRPGPDHDLLDHDRRALRR